MLLLMTRKKNSEEMSSIPQEGLPTRGLMEAVTLHLSCSPVLHTVVLVPRQGCGRRKFQFFFFLADCLFLSLKSLCAHAHTCMRMRADMPSVWVCVCIRVCAYLSMHS